MITREELIAYDEWLANNMKGTIDETTEERVDWYLKAINSEQPKSNMYRMSITVAN